MSTGKELLAALKAGAYAGIADQIRVILEPLRKAKSKPRDATKAAVAKHGQFVTQAVSLVARALSQPKLDKAAKAALLQISVHILEVIPAVATLAKCSKPLQIEKMAVNIIQKHGDGRIAGSDLLPIIDDLISHVLAQGSAGAAAAEHCGTHPACMSKPHDGGRQTCPGPVPAEDTTTDTATVIISCLQAKAAWMSGGSESELHRVQCVVACCTGWVDHLQKLDRSLSMRYRGSMARVLHCTAQKLCALPAAGIRPFLCCLGALETLLPPGLPPIQQGFASCVDQLAKVEQCLCAEKAWKDRPADDGEGIREGIDGGYQTLIDRIVSGAGYKVDDWVVSELFKVIEQASMSCETETSARYWQQFVSWCESFGSPTAAIKLMVGAANLNHGVLVVQAGGGDLTALLDFDAAILLLRAGANSCLVDDEDSTDGIPIEYSVLVRMLGRGSTFQNIRRLVSDRLRTRQACSTPAERDALFPTLSAIAVSIAELITKGHEWELANLERLKSGPKFGHRLIKLQLDMLNVGTNLLLENWLVQDAHGKDGTVQNKDAKGRKKNKKKQVAANPTQVAHEVDRGNIDDVFALMEAAEAECRRVDQLDELRSVASNTYNVGVKLYNIGELKSAITAVTQSCRCLVDWCHAKPESVEKANACGGLCTRWSLISKMHQKTENQDAAVVTLRDGLHTIVPLMRIKVDRTSVQNLVTEFVTVSLNDSAPQDAQRKQNKSTAAARNASAAESLCEMASTMFEKEQVTSDVAGLILEQALTTFSSQAENGSSDEQQHLIGRLLLESVYVADSVGDCLGRSRVLLRAAQLNQSARRKLTAGRGDNCGAIDIVDGVIGMLELQLESFADEETMDHCSLMDQLARAYICRVTLLLERRFQGSTGTVEGEDLSHLLREALQQAVQLFSRVIRAWNAEDGLPNETIVPDPQSLLNELYMLADLLGLIGDHALQMYSIGLRRLFSSVCAAGPLANRCLMAEQVTSLADISILQRRLRVEDDYNDFAEQAANEVSSWGHGVGTPLSDTETGRCKRAEIQVKLAQALDCIAAEENEKGLEILQGALDVCLAGRGRHWISMAANCRCYIAQIYAAQGNTYGAMKSSFDCLQARVQLLPACTEFLREAAASEDKARRARPEDSSFNVGMKLSKGSASALPSQSCVSQWGLISALLESLLQTGRLAVAYGRGKEGDTYLRAALNIAQRIGALSWIVEILYFQAETSFHRRDYSKCQMLLDRLMQDWKNSECPLMKFHMVRAQLLRGNCLRKCGDIEQSLSLYSQGAIGLDAILRADAIAGSYQFTIDDETYSMNTILPDDFVKILPKGISARTRSNSRLQSTVLSRLKAELLSNEGRSLALAGDHEESASKMAAAMVLLGDKINYQRATTLYFSGCVEHERNTMNESARVWMLHKPAKDVLKSSTNKNGGRGKGARSKGAKGKKCYADTALSMIQKFEAALQISTALNLTELAVKSCHMLAFLTGRVDQTRSLRLLHQSLCQPLCKHMQSIIAAKGDDVSGAQSNLSQIFSCENLGSNDAFSENVASKIPAAWTTCTITLDMESSSRDIALLITRFRTNGSRIVVRVLVGDDSSSDQKTWIQMTEAWSQLMDDNVQSMNVELPQGGGKKHSAAQKAKWWERRKKVDSDISTFLTTVESHWFGGLKGLLLGQLKNSAFSEDLSLRLESITAQCDLFGGFQPDTSLLCAIMESVDMLSDDELQKVCRDLIAGTVSSTMKFIPGTKIKVGDLGKKLANVIRTEFDAACQAFSEATGLHERLPTILLLGPELMQIPWESMPCLVQQSVSRMPSLPFVLARLDTVAGPQSAWHQVQPGVKPASAFYVLNPESDLAATQQALEPSFVGRAQWEGIIGERPTAQSWRAGLCSKDVFIYCGHGTGERYFRGREMPSMERCAVTFLMGCSSGKMTNVGDFGAEGMPLWYILSGCPALVANLWDVTDRDIDKFSAVLLETWLPDGSIPAADGYQDSHALPPLSQAREACKLKFVNGAAPVCYGIPVRVG